MKSSLLPFEGTSEDLVKNTENDIKAFGTLNGSLVHWSETYLNEHFSETIPSSSWTYFIKFNTQLIRQILSKLVDSI